MKPWIHFIYVYVCIFSWNTKIKGKPRKLWGSPAEVTRTPTCTHGWKRSNFQFHSEALILWPYNQLFIYSQHTCSSPCSCTQSPTTSTAQKYLYRLQVSLDTLNKRGVNRQGNLSLFSAIVCSRWAASMASTAVFHNWAERSCQGKKQKLQETSQKQNRRIIPCS